MNDVSLTAFGDELEKIAGIRDWWNKLTDVFRSPKQVQDRLQNEKAKRRVDYHFSPKAGDDKWDKLIRNARDPKFVTQFTDHPESTDKDTLHVQRMGQLSRGKTLAKIQSSRLPGRSYEIRAVPGGFACTCPDWRFKGSTNQGYVCKHIQAYEAGKVRANGIS